MKTKGDDVYGDSNPVYGDSIQYVRGATANGLNRPAFKEIAGYVP